MSRTATNVAGFLITLLAGLYFYVMYCSSCAASGETEIARQEVAAETEENVISPELPSIDKALLSTENR